MSWSAARKTPPPLKFYKPVLDAIPTALRRFDSFVLFQFAYRNGRWVKHPFQPNGRLASSTNPNTWSSFQSVSEAYQGGDWSGVGYVLGADDPFTALDLDKVIDRDRNTVEPWALQLVRDLDSYTELSPSGTGLHIFIRGELPAQGRRAGQLEIYDRARYMTLTGKVLGTRRTIERRQPKLDKLLAEYFPKAAPTSVTLRRSVITRSDRDVLDLARRAKNGERFSALYDRGDLSLHGGDHSRADLSLMCSLIFWTADPTQAERLFSASALGQRSKWITRPDYRARTIGAAIATVTDTYAGATE